MKKLLCCLVAVLLLASVFSCAAFADGETLVIYSARNERLNNIVIPAFEAKTGIKVEMITGSSGEVLQRVKAEVESGNVTVDIHWAADETMLAANRDLFEVYVSSENDALRPAFRNDGTNCFNNAYAEPNVMIVNTDLLASGELFFRFPVPDRHAVRCRQGRSDEPGGVGLYRCLPRQS